MVLPLYVGLRTLGVTFFGEYIDYVYDLARGFADELRSRRNFELLVCSQSNIDCFRVRATPEEADALQLRLREVVNLQGRFFIMRTTMRGATWLRVVLMNPATRLADLRTPLDELTDLARAFESTVSRALVRHPSGSLCQDQHNTSTGLPKHLHGIRQVNHSRSRRNR